MTLPIRSLTTPALLAVLLSLGCGGKGNEKTPAPKTASAHVDAPKPEAELTTVTLSADAVKRLGVETVTLRTDNAAAMRSLGGEVVVPEGKHVTITAPFAGTVELPATTRAGLRVTRGTRLMRVLPLAASDRDQRIEAKRVVDAAQAEAEASRQRLERLERLLKEGAASLRSVEEARAQAGIGAAALTAAREKLNAIRQGAVGPRGEVSIEAPFDGVIQTVSAATEQTVAASAALLEIAQVSTLWIRVPVFPGDLNEVDTAQPASIARLGGGSAPISGRRVAAPLKADPTAASVDVYYEVSTPALQLSPGERVMVEVPLKAAEKALAVPDSAVLYDIHGDTWVYEDLGNNAYARRRVEIARHAGGRAVIARGVGEGAKIVTAGAAELFGTEFGPGGGH